MNDFSEYTYGRALRFFEAYYPYDVEDIHYADVMLSMGQCKSIDELVTVSERLKDKIEKINNYTLSKLSNDVNKKLASCISSEEPVFDFDKRERMLRSDVNSCYDENVFRLFKENESITASACGECFINLSHCWDLILIASTLMTEYPMLLW